MTNPRPMLCWLTALTLVLLLQSIRCNAQVLRSPHGYMTPSGKVYKKVGEDLRFICNLNNATAQNNSRNLTFTDRGVSVPDQYVTRLNNSAIQMHIPHVPKMEHVITCKYSTLGIGYSEVYVGLEPIPVTDFRCISNNWETLNCTFNFKDNPISTKYKLAYGREGDAFSNVEELEPFINQTQPVYWFNLPRYVSVVEKYAFNLTLSNRFGVRHQEFLLENFRAIRPNAPFHINVTMAPGQPVNLTWEISNELRIYKNYDGMILTEIRCESEYDRRGPLVETYYPSNYGHKILDNLTAFTRYEVHIRIRMSGADPARDELWSDYAYFAFQTLSRIPDKPPETDIGAFSVNDLNDVVIFWRELRVYEHNAANAGYVITKSLVEGHEKQLKANISRTSAKLQDMRDQTIEFEIRSSNAEGLSRRASFIKVPRKADRVPYPTELKKNRHGTEYTLTWREPRTYARQITSYTVFWCKSKSELPNQCEGSIDFERVDANNRIFTKNTTEGINFAVSANTQNSSSGMVWALCTASESDDIGKLKTIWMSSITATSMEIQWSLECVDRPILRNYNLSYCPITAPKDLTCREGTEKSTLLSNDLTHYTINGLKPYTTYRTILTMISDTRVGPPSDARINTTYEATPSNPQNLVQSEVKNTSVLLRWDAPENMNGVLKNYEIWYNQHYEVVYDDFKAGKTNFTYRLEKLESFTEYRIVVRACSNCCNCSIPSNAVKIRTDIGTPGIVDTQQYNNEPKKRVKFKWTAPVLRAGNVDYYEVKIQNSASNTTTLRRTQSEGCILNVGKSTETMGVEEQKWQVQVRAVNIIWSPHAKFQGEDNFLAVDAEGTQRASSARFQRHSSLGSDRPPAQSLEVVDRDSSRRLNTVDSFAGLNDEEFRSCAEDDAQVLRLLEMDEYRQELAGPWSRAYTHVTSTASSMLQTVVAIMVFVALLFAFGVYLYKKFFRLKEGKVVLPPGLTDIAAKPSENGIGGGGLIVGGGGGLLGHGNGTVVGADSQMGSRAHIRAADPMFDVKGSSSGGGGGSSSGSSPQMTFEDRQLASAVTALAQSETNSLHEQEQSLLEDRIDTQSSASSSSIMMMMEHEEGAMLSGGGEEEEEDDEEQQSRLGLPASLQHTGRLQDIVNIKAQQLQQHQAMPHLNTQLQQQTVIKPAANGYVTIAQRSDGYTKLRDLMKPVPGMAEDKGITGYVTHKQLADFGQRMQ